MKDRPQSPAKNYPALLQIALRLTDKVTLGKFLRQEAGVESLEELKRLGTTPITDETRRKLAREKYGVHSGAIGPCHYRNLLSVACKIFDRATQKIFLSENGIESMPALRQLAETETPIDKEAIENAALEAQGGRRHYPMG